MSEKTKDRKKILYLTSRMFDNPDSVGLYPTTEFYDDMEEYIKSIRNDYKEQMKESYSREEVVTSIAQFIQGYFWEHGSHGSRKESLRWAGTEDMIPTICDFCSSSKCEGCFTNGQDGEKYTRFQLRRKG